MIYIFFFILLLCPLSALASDDLPISGMIDNRSITVLRPATGISYLYDQRGNSATVYESGPNLSWYSQQDKYGKIQSQGYVFDLLKQQPLRVPDSMRYLPPQLSK